jgi:hypothetical protein
MGSDMSFNPKEQKKMKVEKSKFASRGRGQVKNIMKSSIDDE